MTLKVMLSSVRAGLADVRDTVAPVIKIVPGYDVIRFEDAPGASVPSRAVCVEMVERCDIYLLILGERYGDVMTGTGQAPTEEEWSVARKLGKPTVVFKRSGMDPEPAQKVFIAKVENYESGVFRYSFRDIPDLLGQLPDALARAADELRPSAPRPLAAGVAVPWREADRRMYTGAGTVLETHVMPIGPAAPLPAATFGDLRAVLARTGQEHGLFELGRALELSVTEAAVTAMSKRDGRTGEAAARVTRDRTISLWESLPTELMRGAILDQAQFRRQVARDLRLAAAIGVIDTDEVAVAIGFADVSMLGVPSGHSSMSLPFTLRGERGAYTDATESWLTRQLGPLADHVATEAVAALMLRLEGER